jgi:fluoroquinolone transport system permease protein
MTLVVAFLFAIVFSVLLSPEHIGAIIPPALLFIVGGTTVVFVAILIIDEKELGILNALTVTPLNSKEYLIMLGVPITLAYYRVGLELPKFFLLALGVLIINTIYSMLGVGLIVRFGKFTDFMFPAVIILVFFQVPSLYFADIITSKLLLLIPSAAPVMLVYGAFNSLEVWEWIYGIGYSVLVLIGFALWSYKAYMKHIVENLS